MASGPASCRNGCAWRNGQPKTALANLGPQPPWRSRPAHRRGAAQGGVRRRCMAAGNGADRRRLPTARQPVARCRRAWASAQLSLRLVLLPRQSAAGLRAPIRRALCRGLARSAAAGDAGRHDARRCGSAEQRGVGRVRAAPRVPAALGASARSFRGSWRLPRGGMSSGCRRAAPTRIGGVPRKCVCCGICCRTWFMPNVVGRRLRKSRPMNLPHARAGA